MDTDLADVARRLLETAKRLDNLPSSAVAERLDLREQLRALQSRARKLQGRVSVDLTTEPAQVEVEHRRRRVGRRLRRSVTASDAELERELAKLRARLAEIEDA